MSTISVSAPSVNGDPPLRQIRVQEAPPSALIVADNHEIRVDPNKLANPEQVAAVTEAVGSSTEASFAVDQIVFLPEPFRTDVLRFLDGLEQAAPGRLTYVDENSQSSSRETNLFDAALCHLCGHDDPARCNRSITLAVAAAAIQHPDALRAACSRIKARLKHLEVQGYRVDALFGWEATSSATAIRRAPKLCPTTRSSLQMPSTIETTPWTTSLSLRAGTWTKTGFRARIQRRG